MNTMIWLRHKFVARVSGGASLMAAFATGAISQTTTGIEMTAQEIVGKSRDAYATLASYSDSGTAVSEVAGQKNTLTFKIRLQRPNLYRVNWVGDTRLKGMPGTEGVVWSDGRGDYLFSSGPGQEKNAKPQKMQNMKGALSAAAGSSWSVSLKIPGVFFSKDFGDAFVALVTSGHYQLQKEKDARLGDVDCYVLSSVADLSKSPEAGKEGTASTMLWIGKKDFLIHQCRTRYVHKVDPSPPPSEQEIDATIKKTLEMQNKPATAEAISAMRPQMRAIMKQTQNTIKSGFEAGIITTLTHENIRVNENLPPTAFTR